MTLQVCVCAVFHIINPPTPPCTYRRTRQPCTHTQRLTHTHTWTHTHTHTTQAHTEKIYINIIYARTHAVLSPSGGCVWNLYLCYFWIFYISQSTYSKRDSSCVTHRHTHRQHDTNTSATRWRPKAIRRLVLDTLGVSQTIHGRTEMWWKLHRISITPSAKQSV